MLRKRTMAGRRWTLLTLALAVATFGVLWGAMTVSAQSANYSATLSGQKFGTPVETTASGSFSASIADDTLTFTLNASGEGFTQAHIHQGAAGEDGPVVAFLYPLNEAGTDSINRSGTIMTADLLGPVAGDWDAFVAAISSGGTYVNVHSIANPAGEIRGQIGAVASGLPSTGSGGLADGDGGANALLWGAVAAGLVLTVGLGGRTLARRER